MLVCSCWGSSATSGEGSKRHTFRSGEKTKYGCGPTLGSTQLVARNRFLVPKLPSAATKLAGEGVAVVVSVRGPVVQPGIPEIPFPPCLPLLLFLVEGH